MPPPAVVVIGASAGGLEALTAIVQQLPGSLPACLLVVMHSSSSGQSVLPRILQRTSSLPVTFAGTDDPIVPGHIYVARPDLHLLVGPRGVTVVHGPRENGFRPAIDPLFRTAGRELGARAIGVILSGALSDGTYGLSVIKQRGGTAIVQDPDDAAIPSMPQSAIRYVEVDRVLPASEIAAAIVYLAEKIARSQGGMDMPRAEGVEPQQASGPTEIADMQQMYGAPSALTCPDCGGALWQVQEDRVVRFECHVGHQYAPENLEAAQLDEIDGALWSAVRVLEEHADLKGRLAHRAAESGMRVVSEGFAEGARDARHQADRIRSVLFSLGNGNEHAGAAARAEDRSKAPRRAGTKGARHAARTRATKA
jgi:two-component system chemotaxis response regulator CheB